jgi:hypothetical protein
MNARVIWNPKTNVLTIANNNTIVTFDNVKGPKSVSVCRAMEVDTLTLVWDDVDPSLALAAAPLLARFIFVELSGWGLPEEVEALQNWCLTRNI